MKSHTHTYNGITFELTDVSNVSSDISKTIKISIISKEELVLFRLLSSKDQGAIYNVALMLTRNYFGKDMKVYVPSDSTYKNFLQTGQIEISLRFEE